MYFLCSNFHRPAGRGGQGAVQSHAGVQVMVVGLARHVGHGEGYRCAVGDGHCRGHEKELKVTQLSGVEFICRR